VPWRRSSSSRSSISRVSRVRRPGTRPAARAASTATRERAPRCACRVWIRAAKARAGSGVIGPAPRRRRLFLPAGRRRSCSGTKCRKLGTADPSGYHACSSPGVARLGKQPDHGLYGAACRNRTDDLLITSEMSTTSKKLHPNRFEYKFPSYAINLPYGVARTLRRRTIRGGHRVARRTVPTGCRVVPGGSTKGWHASRRSPCPR